MAKQTRDNAVALSELAPVPFHDDTVWAFEKGDQIYVALKPIVESLGLSWSEEHRKLKRNNIFKGQFVVWPMWRAVGDPEAVCIPAQLVAGWLFLLPEGRLKPALRAKLRVYQMDCYRHLVQWFEPIDTKMLRAGWSPESLGIKLGRPN